MRRFAVLLVGLLLPVALAAAELPAHASAPAAAHVQTVRPTRVLANCNHLAVKPRRVVVTCADFGIYVVVRHYRSWTPTAALGRGVYTFNDCKPSCAGGTFHHYPAHLRLGRVVKTRRGLVFSRMWVRWTAHGTTHRAAYSLPTRPLG